VLDRAGRCDVLVHAAAAFDRSDLAGLKLAVWRRVQAVNVESALLLAQAFVPGMAAAPSAGSSSWSPTPYGHRPPRTCCRT
jgi:NAD(P)-dependent dehydrogenase (short-subunit alcohol dehydrogenase family)